MSRDRRQSLVRVVFVGVGVIVIGYLWLGQGGAGGFEQGKPMCSGCPPVCRTADLHATPPAGSAGVFGATVREFALGEVTVGVGSKACWVPFDDITAALRPVGPQQPTTDGRAVRQLTKLTDSMTGSVYGISGGSHFQSILPGKPLRLALEWDNWCSNRRPRSLTLTFGHGGPSVSAPVGHVPRCSRASARTVVHVTEVNQ